MQRDPTQPTQDTSPPINTNASQASPVPTDVSSIVAPADPGVSHSSKHPDRQLPYYQVLFDHAPVGYLIADPNGLIIEANIAIASMLGYERSSLIDHKLTELVPYEQRLILAQHLMSVLYHQQSAQYDIQLRHHDGSFIDTNLHIVPYHNDKQRFLLISCIENTAIHQNYHNRIIQLKQQHERERLESMDVLAGGIAHDLNNLMQVVAGNIELAHEAIAHNHEALLRQNLSIAIQTVQDATQLIKQMLLFAGRGRMQMQPLDLNQFLAENQEFLRSSLANHILFEIEPSTEPISISASPQHLRQMLLNLILNAADAIGAKPGIINLTVGKAYLDENVIQRYRISDTAQTGWFGYLQISDTGSGMDEHTLNHMFDPYFSTKETGNGLGLAMVRATTRLHRGVLQVSSRQSHGTTITLCIPQASL